MKLTKLFSGFAVLMLALVLSVVVSGCSLVQTVGDYFSENPLVASVVVRQSVVRYIDAGESPIDILKRKDDTIDVLTKTLDYLDGNPRARVDALMSVLREHIEWDSLSAPDRLLLMDVIEFVQTSLEAKQAENELPEDTALAIRALLVTAISAAESY